MMTQLALKKCEKRSLTVEECCQCQLGICFRQQNLVLSNFFSNHISFGQNRPKKACVRSGGWVAFTIRRSARNIKNIP